LIDGVLVEKTMGWQESSIAIWLGHRFLSYLDAHPIGKVAGADGPCEMLHTQVRFPDVSFASWDRIPTDADPKVFAPDWTPNLAVEVLSPSNTRKEMQRKLEDYFSAGVQLVWYIDPDERIVEVFTGVNQKRTFAATDTLTGGAVLPGFEVSVKDIFEAGEFRRPSR
jgi:Uma2 family endonuclease